MKKTILFIFLLYIVGNISGQNRYRGFFTDSVTVENFVYATKGGVQLKLDVYQPFNDRGEDRVLVLYVHGGGFSGGTHNDENSVSFCTKLAEMGYVSASMSYRLTRKGKPGAFGCDCPAAEKIVSFEAAAEDIRDAVSFFVKNKEMLRVNTQKIIMAGSSAGAEAILYAGYKPPTYYDYPVSYAGLISMAGAIPDTSVINNETAVPTLFFHGTCDNLVPYASAPHHYCEEGKPGYLILHGSYSIAKKLRSLNAPYWLHTSCGAAHELSWVPKLEYFDEITEFCYQYVIKGQKEFRETIIPGDQTKCNYRQFNFCEQ